MARKRKEESGGGSRASEEAIIVDITPSLMEQARRELVREKWITPYKVASRYGIKVSLAKKLLRTLEREGLIVLFSKNRRSPVYVPKERAPISPPKGL
ncbi:MAG: 30S ribosomal protein S25e [Desulfurococcales archaeon]|nr:30S ribosomal protein S25e [Desulfurococcales archaeon]